MSYQAYPNLGFPNPNLNPHAPRLTSHLPQQPHPSATATATPSAQASLQSSLNALNGKIVQAQSLALLNGITVDEVLARMGGLTEMELGLLRLCAAREQEARLSASLVNQQQQMAILQQQQQQQQQLQQSKRNSNRLSFPGLPSTKSAATNASGNGWEEGFANLSLGQGEARTPTPKSASSNPMSFGGRVSPPVTTLTSTSAVASRAESGRGDKRSSVILQGPGASSVGMTGTGKHEQAASWRSASASGKMPQTTGVVPLNQTAPRNAISTSSSNEPASKGFNSLFGNKVVPRQTSRASSAGSSPTDEKNHAGEEEGGKSVRTGRSGSASSSSASSDVSLSNAQDNTQQQRQDHLENLLAGANRAREMTFSGSSSSFESVVTPPPVLITPPCDQYAGRQNSGSMGYFGIKKVLGGNDDVQVHGQGQPMNANANVRNGLGVIGQGFGATQAIHQRAGTASYGVVVRQPHGPPGGADELGNKNFASRLRQKAVSDLGLLGRRRANSPNPNGYAIAA